MAPRCTMPVSQAMAVTLPRRNSGARTCTSVDGRNGAPERSLFRRSQAMADAELRVRSAKLEGFPPYPTWNGTIAAPLEDTRGLLSVLGADGELVVLQNSWNDDENGSADIWMRVVKVLPPAVEKSSSFCQCWTKDGSIIATAHDRSVIVYSSEDFTVLVKLRLQFSATSMDITKRSTADGKEFLLLVGTAFGAFLYKIALGNDRAESDTAEQTPTPLARICDEIAVCMVKFSGDGCTVALGSMDGRLFLRRLHSHEDDVLASFGASILSRVLIAPRITSLSFSTCSTKLVVATRKGNVYVFYCTSDTKEWRSLPSCKDLSTNPKPKGVGAAGVNKAATAAQTQVACWGLVFVVCSRAIESRLEVYDFVSGRLLHSLQHAPTATALNQRVEQQLITGVCCLQIAGGTGSRLLCHDTSANVTAVEWPFLDVIEER
ncbi:hypothetical protein V7S43_007907 [Phytophthora oleae]|uniref:Anaphase-promoting complex subunit 4 WD40 domain-containing protein n=1 Tax=Phytophthora oleae TaxID=2107226 RepID=A0ABD3FJ71_9STRA